MSEVRCTGLTRWVLVALLTALSVGVAGAGAAESPRFEKVVLAHPVTATAVNADGTVLVAAHEQANLLSIIEVASGRKVKEVAAKSPRTLVLRKGRAYVGSAGHKTIQVFDASTWKQVDELGTGLDGVLLITAPADEASQDRLYVLGEGEKQRAVVAVDTVADKPRKVPGEFAQTSYISLDAGGAYLVFSQGTMTGQRAAIALIDEKSAHLDVRQTEIRECAYQTQPGDRYVTGTSLDVYPQGHFELGLAVIPDLKQRCVYAITDRELVAHRIDGDGAAVARRNIVVPEWLLPTPPNPAAPPVRVRPPRLPVHPAPRPNPYAVPKRVHVTVEGGDQKPDMSPRITVHRPLAVNLDSTLYLYLVNPQESALYWAKMPTFVDITFSLPVSCTADAKFEPVHTEDRASSLLITEDGKHLAISSSTLNRVNVYDIVTGKLIKRLPCVAPQGMLAREGLLFIASQGAGRLSVFSTKDWTEQKPIPLPNTDPFFISAATGTDFDGRMIVTCLGPKHREPGRCPIEAVAVNLRAGKATTLARPPHSTNSGRTPVTVDQRGKVAVEISTFDSGSVEVFDFDYYFEGKYVLLGQPIGQANGMILPLRKPGMFVRGYDVRTDAGRSSLTADQKVRLIVPNAINDEIYVLKDETLDTFTTSPVLTLLNSRPLPPLESREYKSPVRLTSVTTFDYERQAAAPVATTIAGKTYIFGHLQNKNSLMRCCFPAHGHVPEATPRNSAEFPATIAVNRSFTFQFPQASGATWKIASGPSGVTISPAGLLAWIPKPANAGRQTIKVQRVVGDESTFYRHEVEVVDAAAAAATTMPSLNSLVSMSPAMGYTADYQGILINDNYQLVELDAAGEVKRKLPLPRLYRKLGERQRHYVGLTSVGLEQVDKTTGKVLKAIAAQGIRYLQDMALHPGGSTIYLAVVRDGNGPLETNPLAQLDETTGRFQLIPKSVATFLSLDPAGRTLYSGYHEFVHSGYRFAPMIGAVRDYEEEDALLSFDATAQPPRPLAVNFDPGQGGQRVLVSHDARRVVYVGNCGPRAAARATGGVELAIFDASDIKKPKVMCKLPGPSRAAAFHPTLDLLAVVAGESVAIFDAATGAAVEGLAQYRSTEDLQVQGLLFTPDGKHLALTVLQKSRGTVLHVLPLKLSAAQLARLPARPRRPDAATAAPIPAPSEPRISVAAADLESLFLPRSNTATNAKEIGRRNLDSVVVVRGEDSVGTGFVVGAKGYILTCAHVVPALGAPRVLVRRTVLGKVEVYEVPAIVAFTDPRADLALLKIEPKQRLSPVRITDQARADAGEQVVAIGNPGLGDKTLDHTMTQGIVSKPVCELDGMNYLQVDAAVNPGSSGGPVFDGKGNLIGMVVLKGRIESAGFAVPAPTIRAFLQQCAKSGAARQPVKPLK